MNESFDAIVVGSGITGGWAAKELTERGLKVLMIERGPMIEHQVDYKTETIPPWQMEFRGRVDPLRNKVDYPVQSTLGDFDEWTSRHFVNDRDNPYQATYPFAWFRGYQLGGRSLMWGRQCYRWSDLDFGANLADGYGEDWPIRYADLAPWYDHVESFIGVSGSMEGLPQLPDGKFQPPMALNIVEQRLAKAIAQKYPERRLIPGRTANLTQPLPGRAPCQYRGICARGCSYGAYFSTQSSTLPAARATGRLTLMTDSLVDNLVFDAVKRRVTAVRVINTKTRSRMQASAKVVFLCAGSINSLSVLLRSASQAAPGGLGNSSGRLGRYFMDHALAMSVIARAPSLKDHTYFGNRPNGIVIPRYFNVAKRHESLLRGYFFQGMAWRAGWTRGLNSPGLGVKLKSELRRPGDWHILLGGFAEALPVRENRVTLDDTHVDPYGLPQTRIEFQYGKNELSLLKAAERDAIDMVRLIGGEVISSSANPGPGGTAIHEMGGAPMGRNPATSVLNDRNQLHDAPNVFVTDGAAMASSACQNPSLTYMAITARAAAAAVSELKAGRLS